MKLMDYVFYRAYMAYEKKNEPGLFGATAYCTSISIFLFLPILGLVGNIFDDQRSIRKITFIIYAVVIITGMFIRYYRGDKLKQILERYKGSAYNKRIPTWSIFLLLPLSMILGVWSYALVG